MPLPPSASSSWRCAWLPHQARPVGGGGSRPGAAYRRGLGHWCQGSEPSGARPQRCQSTILSHTALLRLRLEGAQELLAELGRRVLRGHSDHSHHSLSPLSLHKPRSSRPENRGEGAGGSQGRREAPCRADVGRLGGPWDLLLRTPGSRPAPGKVTAWWPVCQSPVHVCILKPRTSLQT